MSLYGYSRISVDDGTDRSVSIPSQQSDIDRYAAHKWPGEAAEQVADPGISGGVPLAKRPHGGPLLSKLVKDDHLIVAKTDRAFRSVLDGAAIIVELQERGVSLHLLDLNIDTSTPMGRAMAHVAIVFAELERERIGERRRAAATYRRSQAVPTMAADYAPLGWRIVTVGEGENSRREFREYQLERETCMEIAALKRQGLTYLEIAQRLNLAGTPRRRGRRWTRSGVRRAVAAARDEFPLISEDCRRWGSESGRYS